MLEAINLDPSQVEGSCLSDCGRGIWRVFITRHLPGQIRVNYLFDPELVLQPLQRVAQRLEAELGEEQGCFIEGCQRDWDALPPPGPPITVGLDGGFVHAKAQKSRGEGWFEVIAGKSVPQEGAAKCFAYVQIYDAKPKRRLFEVLKSQGLQANQQVTFLSDGADDVRELPLYLT